jgi:hypothetical protein
LQKSIKTVGFDFVLLDVPVQWGKGVLESFHLQRNVLVSSAEENPLFRNLIRALVQNWRGQMFLVKLGSQNRFLAWLVPLSFYFSPPILVRWKTCNNQKASAFNALSDEQGPKKEDSNAELLQ